MDYNNYGTTYTNYGGGAGAGAGGFIEGDSGSQTSPSARRSYQDDTLRPVTIKQLLDAEVSGDEIKVDGQFLSQITFVGQIRNISKQSLNITYKVDDGTGSIEVKHWLDRDLIDLPNPVRDRLVENSYCRVWGKMKTIGKPHVNAPIIRPIDDLNEMSCHLLEATVVHLYFTRGPLSAQTAAAGAGKQAYGNQYGQQQDQQGQQHGAGANMGGLSNLARQVYDLLMTAEQSNEGLHKEDIASRLNLPSEQVRRAGNELMDSGRIYTTVDDDTWAILETV